MSLRYSFGDHNMSVGGVPGPATGYRFETGLNSGHHITTWATQSVPATKWQEGFTASVYPDWPTPLSGQHD